MYKNIKHYIGQSTPRDIKSTRTVSPQMLSYINSPVVFHISFIIERETTLLRKLASEDTMQDYLRELREIATRMQANSTIDGAFFTEMEKRLSSFENEFIKNAKNLKLFRSIYLVSLLAGIVFFYLTIIKRPSNIAWVSDRDAIVQRHGGVAYDMAYLVYALEYTKLLAKGENPVMYLPEKPFFHFPAPEVSGENDFDELVRIPDYLAGTLADFDFKEKTFSKEKFWSVMAGSMVTSKNQSLIQVVDGGDHLTTRRLIFT